MDMRITGRGHANILATHRTTIAFTRDAEVTKRGDCFVAVGCDWAVTPEFLAALRAARGIVITIECGSRSESVLARGHPELTLTERDLVIRKSDWVDGRTLCIGADKAANGLDRALVAELSRGSPVKVKVTVVGAVE